MYTPKYKMYVRSQDHIANDKFEDKTHDKERGIPSGYRFSAE